MYLARFISVVKLLWCLLQSPLLDLGRIFPLSLVNLERSSDSKNDGVFFSLQKKHAFGASNLFALLVGFVFFAICLLTIYYSLIPRMVYRPDLPHLLLPALLLLFYSFSLLLPLLLVLLQNFGLLLQSLLSVHVLNRE